jgi:hypothetical protein
MNADRLIEIVISGVDKKKQGKDMFTSICSLRGRYNRNGSLKNQVGG